MSVNPGWGGQAFIPYILDKIKTLKNLIKQHDAKTKIAIDGGVNIENISDIVKAGANMCIVGSALFCTEDYAVTLTQLKEQSIK